MNQIAYSEHADRIFLALPAAVGRVNPVDMIMKSVAARLDPTYIAQVSRMPEALQRLRSRESMLIPDRL